MATLEQYLTQINKDIQNVGQKVEILDFDEKLIRDISGAVVGGDISESLRNGSRRGATIRLQNTDGNYLVAPDKYIWADKKIKLYSSILVEGDYYDIPQGIYYVGDPDEDSSGSNNSVSLNLYDKFSFLDGTLSGDIQFSVIIDAGSNFTTAIQALFIEAGEVKPVIVAPNSFTLPYSIVKDSGTYGEIIIELVEAFSWVVYYDEDGNPRIEPPTDTDTSAVRFTFESHKIGVTRNLDLANLKNSIRVVGDTIDGQIFDYLAEDTDPSSNTSISKVGKRTLTIEDDIIYSDALAQERAEYELSNSIKISDTTSINCPPIPHIRVGDIIAVVDSNLELEDARYLVQSISKPFLMFSEMQVSAWRTTSF